MTSISEIAILHHTVAKYESYMNARMLYTLVLMEHTHLSTFCSLNYVCEELLVSKQWDF